MFGPVHCGVSTSNLPTELLNSLETEEQLDEVLHSFATNDDIESYNAEPATPLERIDETDKNFANKGDTKSHDVESTTAVAIMDEICIICDDKMVQPSNVTPCKLCDLIIHNDCGTVFDDDFVCPICLRGQEIAHSQDDCFEKQKIAAKKMANSSADRFVKIDEGDCISLTVPKVDRGPLDFGNILGVVMLIKNGVYQVGTSHGVIKGWFPRTDIGIARSNTISKEIVPTDILITLREAAAKQSLSGGQGFAKCNCKPSTNQCRTKRCNCFKNERRCNSRCHLSSTCCNKHDI